MMQYFEKNANFCKWFLINLFLLSSLSAVKSINVKSLPYSIINMEEDTESLLKLSENDQKDELIPQVSRRGYAGEDFYQKASKSIPRMGRRGIRADDSDKDKSTVPQSSKTKRPYIYQLQDDYSVWPWHTDRVPNYVKRETILDDCRYWPKFEKLFTDVEYCNENLLCCSAVKESPILKRFLQTYASKQTGTKPDYKNNQYM